MSETKPSGPSTERRVALTEAMKTGTLANLPWVDAQQLYVPEAGTLLDDRYELRQVIGQGTFGAVFEAHDQASDEPVAVKILSLPHPGLADRMQREISVLRRLDLPGVIGFLDEGLWQDQPYIVMPLVDGTPFPGPVEERSWSALGTRLVALAEAIARVHAAGVLHRDLKPDNVLWLGERSVLLDFGLAQSHRLVEEDDELSGTPAYLAPEQYFGEEPDVRSDLFSFGAIVYESLSGVRPFAGDKLFEVVSQVLQHEPPSLTTFGVPCAVSDVVDQLLRKRREERPSSAEEVVRRLVACLEQPSWLAPGTEPLPARALESLFAGPEVIHHLQSDPARVLWSRTGGWPSAVDQTLNSWERAGVCQRDDDGLVAIARSAVDRLMAGMRVDPCRGWSAIAPSLSKPQLLVWRAVDLLSPWATLASLQAMTELPQLATHLEGLARAGLLLAEGGRWYATRSPPRLPGTLARAAHALAARLLPLTADERIAHLLAADALEEVPATCLAVGRARVEEGQFQRAWSAASEGLTVERRLGAQDDALMVLAAEVALEASSAAWLRMVSLASRRRGLTAIAQLCEHGMKALRRAATAEEFQALQLDAFPTLHIWALRLSAYTYNWGPFDAHHKWVTQVREDALSTQGGASSWAGWNSRLLLRMGRSVEAAEQAAIATERAVSSQQRINSGINAASMFLECGAFDRAQALLDTVEPVLQRCPLPTFEAYLLHTRRSLGYRRGDTPPAWPAYRRALDVLEAPSLTASMMMQYGAAAWRRGELELARFEAEACAEVWQSVGATLAMAMAQSLAVLCDGAVGTNEQLHKIRELVRSDGPPALRAQVLAIHFSAGVEMPMEIWPVLREQLAAMPYPPWARREILSFAEIYDLMPGAPP